VKPRRGWVRQLVRRFQPVDMPDAPRRTGWVLRSDGTPAPADEEQQLHQPVVLFGGDVKRLPENDHWPWSAAPR
jgi:hypothetical protein